MYRHVLIFSLPPSPAPIPKWTSLPYNNPIKFYRFPLTWQISHWLQPKQKLIAPLFICVWVCFSRWDISNSFLYLGVFFKQQTLHELATKTGCLGARKWEWVKWVSLKPQLIEGMWNRRENTNLEVRKGGDLINPALPLPPPRAARLWECD